MYFGLQSYELFTDCTNFSALFCAFFVLFSSKRRSMFAFLPRSMAAVMVFRRSRSAVVTRQLLTLTK